LQNDKHGVDDTHEGGFRRQGLKGVSCSASSQAGFRCSK